MLSDGDGFFVRDHIAPDLQADALWETEESRFPDGLDAVSFREALVAGNGLSMTD